MTNEPVNLQDHIRETAERIARAQGELLEQQIARALILQQSGHLNRLHMVGYQPGPERTPPDAIASWTDLGLSWLANAEAAVMAGG